MKTQKESTEKMGTELKNAKLDEDAAK